MVCGDARCTHDELHERAARLGPALAAGGVRAGHRVALLLHTAFQFVDRLPRNAAGKVATRELCARYVWRLN